MDSFINFIQSDGGRLLLKIWEHLYISMISVGLGVIVAVPIGIMLTRVPKIAGVVIGIVNLIQTIPSLAILALFVPLIGVGLLPALLALFIVSVLPILRNVYTGINGVDKKLLETGKGMGMTEMDTILKVELPLSIPVIMAGIRLSTVYLIGWTALAAAVGAGGLGDFIFDGLSLFDPSLILAGAIPATILAVLADFSLGKLENWLVPDGIQKSNEITE